MPTKAILGGQWGDEGKGKIVDALCEDADVVARFQGGANAGHTIFIGNTQIILHQIPSGILHKNTHCILGNGMVIDPVRIISEISDLKKLNVNPEGRIYISLLAHVVTPLHKALDELIEKNLGSHAIGTTKRGIGPCYIDKFARTGIRIKNLKNINLLKDRLQEKLEQAISRGLIPKDNSAAIKRDFKEFYHASESIFPLAEDITSLIHKYIADGKKILIEGAQGTLLDVDYGSYPYVTSSNTIAGSICTGLGIGPKNIDKIIGVFKSYNTRVGSGPFPTELNTPEGDYLQRRGGEFGATTLRKRRCGWFDAVLGLFAVKLNGFTSLAITKLDVLDDLEEINICTHYENSSYPTIDLNEAIPKYVTYPGWKTRIGEIRKLSDLPSETRKYLSAIEELLQTPISHVSVGRERHDIIEV